MRTMHLFAGAGGGLLADLILGHTPIVAVEWDAYACRVLRERSAAGWFPGLRVHEGDVRLFDPSEFVGRVDSIHAGFPCQDISVAGSGAGIDGERSGLYREILRCADVVRPPFLFLENSPAIVGRGLGTVLGDLAARGYDARWTVLAAADVGAPHQRERWWCLAWRTDADIQPTRSGRPERSAAGKKIGMVGESDLANSGVGRFSGSAERKMEQPGRAKIVGSGEAISYSDRFAGGAGARPGSGGVPSESQSSAGGTGGQAVEAIARRDQRSGWWELEPDVGRVAYGVASRMDRLRAIGNGQVPLCAAAAWRILGGP